MKSMKNKKITQLLNAKDPVDLLDKVNNSDMGKEFRKMGKDIEDGLNVLQEQVIIVQKNQVNFQEYFQATYNKVKDLENKINVLEEKIKILTNTVLENEEEN